MKAATAQRARALAVAAVRETFEESGLMLAKPLKGGAPEQGLWRALEGLPRHRAWRPRSTAST